MSPSTGKLRSSSRSPDLASTGFRPGASPERTLNRGVPFSAGNAESSTLILISSLIQVLIQQGQALQKASQDAFGNTDTQIHMVGAEGIEPTASSVSRKRSTTEPRAYPQLFKAFIY